MARYRKVRAVIDTELAPGVQLVLDAVHSSTDECILWPMSTKSGYGQVGYCRKVVKVHRLVWCLANAEPEPPVVRHTCDNMLCYNPRHLIPGTQADNMQDKVERGRTSKGEARWSAKLSLEDVTSIRSEFVKGTPYKPGNSAELAARYGVHVTRIQMIARGAAWK